MTDSGVSDAVKGLFNSITDDCEDHATRIHLWQARAAAAWLPRKMRIYAIGRQVDFISEEQVECIVSQPTGDRGLARWLNYSYAVQDGL